MSVATILPTISGMRVVGMPYIGSRRGLPTIFHQRSSYAIENTARSSSGQKHECWIGGGNLVLVNGISRLGNDKQGLETDLLRLHWDEYSQVPLHKFLKG